MSEKFRTVDIHCEACDSYYVDMVNKELSAWGTVFTCSLCGDVAAAKVVPSIPNVRDEKSASYVTGVRSQKRDSAIKQEMEALDLEIEASDKPFWERGKINNEIKKLRGEPTDD